MEQFKCHCVKFASSPLGASWRWSGDFLTSTVLAHGRLILLRFDVCWSEVFRAPSWCITSTYTSGVPVALEVIHEILASRGSNVDLTPGFHLVTGVPCLQSHACKTAKWILEAGYDTGDFVSITAESVGYFSE